MTDKVATSSRGAGGRDLSVVTLAARPDLASTMWSMAGTTWPTFMLHDQIGDNYFARVRDDLADTCLLVLADGEVVARAFFLPFSWDGGTLPDDGWDAIIVRGLADRDAGRAPTAASALEISIPPSHRGTGLSGVALDAMRRAVAERGLLDLVAPVRPSHKHQHPHEDMATYLARRSPEGLPADPWLRVHVRAGGRIVKVAPTSMRIVGTIAEWESWLGSPLVGEGRVVVDQALSPVDVDRDADRVTYVEPNVWVHHDLRRLG